MYLPELPTLDNIPALIALIVSLGSMFILFLYYFFVFSKMAFMKVKNSNKKELEPVSLILSARNEHINLKNNLPLLLEQDYPNFQVVVVNDRSWDESEKILEELEKKYSHLKVVTILQQDRYETGKKFAITLGIKAASHENLIFTDADCKPASKNWLRKMTENFSEEKKIVLGYGAYEKSNGLLNKLIRFDTFHSALQYFSLALSGSPYMGVGRNLAYKKSLFFSNKGFASHQHILSGDDDLFVNENATSSNTALEIHPEAFTVSIPKKSFAEWSFQKVRHLSTSKLYKGKHRFVLGVYWTVQIFFVLSLFGMFFFGIDLKIIIALFFIKYLFQYLFFGLSMKLLQERDLILLLPVLDLITLLIYPTFALRGMFTKNTRWK